MLSIYSMCVSESYLGAAEHDQGLTYGRHTSTDVEGLQNNKDEAQSVHDHTQSVFL